MSPRLVLALVEQLPEESRFTGSRRGGGQWHGWTRRDGLLADVYDATMLATRVLGQWKKGKEPTFPPWPRPGTQPAQPVRVADIRKRFGRR